MSFLEKIKQQKLKLTYTDIVIKTISGDVLKESRTPEGHTNIERLPFRSAGFVVDTKPDLLVAKIIDRLYMGSQDVANDRQLLSEYGINNVLSVGIEMSDRFSGIDYFYIDALDTPEFDLLSVFNSSYAIIHDIIDKKRENIYVHCNAGISRSASIVIAFLMKYKRISYSEAYEHVKKCRNTVKPNEGFIQQLKVYETLINKS